LASQGIQILLGDLASDVSRDESLSSFYATSPMTARSVVRDFASHVIRALVQQWQDKLQFWHHLPYSLVGVFWPEDAGVSRTVGRRAIKEWCDALAAGRHLKLHRVAQHFLQDGSDLRVQLETYCGGALPLTAFPSLYVELRAYALNVIVSRRCEGMHSQAKRHFRRSISGMVPSISAAVRQKELASALASPAALQ
jgi:hypothetical protein